MRFVKHLTIKLLNIAFLTKWIAFLVKTLRIYDKIWYYEINQYSTHLFHDIINNYSNYYIFILNLTVTIKIIID